MIWGDFQQFIKRFLHLFSSFQKRSCLKKHLSEAMNLADFPNGHCIKKRTPGRQIEKIFLDRINKHHYIKALIRIKVNFYPHSKELIEHAPHTDDTFSHMGAVFSLNTCNGFTRLSDGTIIDSVENRIVFFDASTSHNSTTTTTDIGRYNINFNFI